MYENAVHLTRKTDEKFTLIEWTLGNKCTYACSYCPEILHSGSVGWQDHEKLLRFLDSCMEHYNGKLGREVIIQYTGGEPTVYPKFKELVRYANEIGLRQSIISNASRTPRFWSDVADYFNKVLFSYHPEEADPEKFIKNVETVCAITDVHVNVLMKPGMFGPILSMCAELARRCPDNVTILLKPIQVDFGSQIVDYTPAEQHIMNTMHGYKTVAPRRKDYPTGMMEWTLRDGTKHGTIPTEIMLDEANTWTGWWCNIGVETLNVDMNGNIWGGLCKVGGSYGNISTQWTFPEEASMCTKHWCTCHLDMMVTKSVEPIVNL